jgi:HEAT repeat protein
MEKQLSDHELKHESRDVQVANTDGQTRNRLIEINSNLIRMLQDAWQQRWNRLPNQTELQQLVDGWIHEEVLFRESLNRGLDRNDELVRRRLIQKMERLSSHLSWTEPPTPEELAAYYAANSEQFQTPAQRSFSQIYFSRSERGDRTEQDALDALRTLNDVFSDGQASSLGDRFMLPGYFAQLTQNDVLQQFGPEFAAAVFETQPEIWGGPIPSAYGLHLVFIHEEIPAQLPPLADIKMQVLIALNAERQQVAIERLFQSFRDQYDIVFDTKDERDYEQEIETLADTWLNEQEDRRESQAKLKEIYNKINALLPPHYHDHDHDHDPHQPFSELALAGGPPHRGTLLEPVSPKEALSDLDRYGDVLQELASGITTETGLFVVMSRTPGWIGVQCDSEEMAIWVLRGMIAENVIVRREGSVLYLPASPKYTLESEIKDVVTACAKVFHYWNEHIAPLDEEHDHDVHRATGPEQAIRVAKDAS